MILKKWAVGILQSFILNCWLSYSSQMRLYRIFLLGANQSFIFFDDERILNGLNASWSNQFAALSIFRRYRLPIFRRRVPFYRCFLQPKRAIIVHALSKLCQIRLNYSWRYSRGINDAFVFCYNFRVICQVQKVKGTEKIKCIWNDYTVLMAWKLGNWI